jgi:hypothetical protein
MQCLESVQQNSKTIVSLVYGWWFFLKAKQGVDSGLRGANGVFDGEYNIVGQFAILPDEGEILRAFRYHMRTIPLLRGRN